MARIKIVKITEPLFRQMLTEGNEIHAKVIEGLPEGAELVKTHYDQRGNLVLTYHHEDWEDVPFGAYAPEVGVLLEDATPRGNE